MMDPLVATTEEKPLLIKFFELVTIVPHYLRMLMHMHESVKHARQQLEEK